MSLGNGSSHTQNETKMQEKRKKHKKGKQKQPGNV